MTKKELLQNSLDEFRRVQKYLQLIQDKDSDIYKEIKQRYNELKVILNSISGFDLSILADIDKIKEWATIKYHTKTKSVKSIELLGLCTFLFWRIWQWHISRISIRWKS